MPSRPSCAFLPTESADLPVPLVAGDGGVQTRTRRPPSWGPWSLRPLQGGVTGALSRPGSAPGLGGGFGTHLSSESSGGPFPVPPRDREGREGLRRCGLRPAGPPPPGVGPRTNACGRKEEVGTGGAGAISITSRGLPPGEKRLLFTSERDTAGGGALPAVSSGGAQVREPWRGRGWAAR